MSFRINAQVQGLGRLIYNLQSMRKSFGNKVLKRGMRKTTGVINRNAKRNIRVGRGATGQLKRSLGTKVKLYPSGIVIGAVEPRGGFSVPVATGSQNFVLLKWRTKNYARVKMHNPQKIAHLIERGTKVRFNYSRSNANRGAVSPRPFLGPALISNQDKMTGIFGQVFQEELDKL